MNQQPPSHELESDIIKGSAGVRGRPIALASTWMPEATFE
jgi:hypothetical protein